MSQTIKNLAFIMLLTSLGACGGSNDIEEAAAEDAAAEEVADETGVEADDVILDTASDVITTLADVNGFKIVTKTLNPRGYDYYGTEVEITAFVKDHSNNNVEDGTVVTFVADDNGMIENQCATTNGTCTVIWTSSRDRSQPVSGPAADDPGYVNDFQITIMARTIGEDSFIDKNSNSLFDAGETFYTQSEPFLDADDDGVYDAGANDFDEFFDFNGNGSFDLDTVFDSIYRGKSCSATAISAGHCTDQLEVWDTVRMINSAGGYVDSVVTNCAGSIIMDTRDGTTSTVALTGKVRYCLEFYDQNGNIPPVGTKIDITTSNGVLSSVPTEVTSKFVLPGSGFEDDLQIEPDGSTSTGSVTIETESVAGDKYSYYFNVTD